MKNIQLCIILILNSFLSATESRPLRAYHNEYYPPIEYLEDGSSQGLSIDLFKAIAKSQNLNYSLNGISWDSIKHCIQTGEFDVLTGLYYSHRNDDYLAYSLCLYTATYKTFIRKDSKLVDLYDPHGKSVVILGGGLSSKLVNDIPSITEITKVNDIEAAMILLNTGKVDCAVLQTLMASYYLKNANIKNIISIGSSLLSRDLCFAVPKGNTVLLEALNEGYKDILSSGEYSRIIDKWVTPYEEKYISWRTLRPYIFAGIVIFILASSLIIVWTTSLQKNVTKRTKELRKEIQERMETEEELRHSRKQLIESNNLKDVLFDIVRHDFKNPVGVIKNMADMIISDDQENEAMHIIKEASDSLLQVINNTSLLGKIAVGEKVKKQSLNVVNEIRQVINEYQSLLDMHDLQVKIDIPEDTVIPADPIIKQVFHNYISNVVKYASDGEKVLINMEKDDHNITINVIDYGTTVPADKAAYIFERSIQLDSGKKEGRGLGLAIVKRVAELHDGDAGVKPNTPTGNIFFLRLPMR